MLQLENEGEQSWNTGKAKKNPRLKTDSCDKKIKDNATIHCWDQTQARLHWNIRPSVPFVKKNKKRRKKRRRKKKKTGENVWI
jgi:hypothetical protein